MSLSFKGLKRVTFSPLFLICFSIGTSLCTGCTEKSVELKKKTYSSQSNDSFCVVEPAQVEEGGYTKILFVVDISGSAGNEPQRARSIKNFVNKQNNEHIQYGLVKFNGSAISPITYSNGTPRFTGDTQEILNAATFGGGGGTNYVPALQAAQKAIQYDIDRSPSERSSYIILFITDGVPGDDPTGTITSLMELSERQRRDIYLSTAYFGKQGKKAIDLLTKMADQGKGLFVNLEDDSNWNLDKLIKNNESDVIPWSLKEFLVYNLNAGFCLDGKVDVDSDTDGMCDRDELEMNRIYATQLAAEGKSFDPANRFSFGDGYGDFFHWLRFKYPGKTLSPCTDRSDEDFDLLTACEENEIERNVDGVNLRGDPSSFDTDKDGILDGIETFVYFPSQNTGIATRYTAALDPENMDDSPDGEESVLVQIKQHRNPWFPDSGLNTAYDTTITPYQSATNDCYNFTQSSLPLYETLDVSEGNTLPGLEHGAGENSVMVYYIQVLQSEPGNQGILKHSVQKIISSSANPSLKVKDGVFNEYVPPEKQTGT